MNSRSSTSDSYDQDRKAFQRLISEEWNKKISIYADMLFSMDPSDFIDFMTGGLAYTFGFFSMMTAVTPPDAFGNACIDPTIMMRDAAVFGGISIFFGALHMLYRYDDYAKWRIDSANQSIKHYKEMMSNADNQHNRRGTLFHESGKSYVASTVESVRKFFGV